jgi:hypothetical protein
VRQLMLDKEIDSTSKVDDPWGSSYRIECGEDDVTVRSPGPDELWATARDLVIPPPMPDASP